MRNWLEMNFQTKDTKERKAKKRRKKSATHIVWLTKITVDYYKSWTEKSLFGHSFSRSTINVPYLHLHLPNPNRQRKSVAGKYTTKSDYTMEY